MKLISILKISTITLTLFAGLSCSKSSSTFEGVNYRAKYRGRVLARYCPAYAVVEVTNSNIGTTWTSNSPHEHVIAIANAPSVADVGKQIAFSIDTATLGDCMPANVMCPYVAINLPKQTYCANSVEVE